MYKLVHPALTIYRVESRLVSGLECICVPELTGRVPFLDIAGVNIECLANFTTLQETISSIEPALLNNTNLRYLRF